MSKLMTLSTYTPPVGLCSTFLTTPLLPEPITDSSSRSSSATATWLPVLLLSAALLSAGVGQAAAAAVLLLEAGRWCISASAAAPDADWLLAGGSGVLLAHETGREELQVQHYVEVLPFTGVGLGKGGFRATATSCAPQSTQLAVLTCCCYSTTIYRKETTAVAPAACCYAETQGRY